MNTSTLTDLNPRIAGKPYSTQLEFVEGLRRVVEARRRVFVRCHGDEEIPCPERHPDLDEIARLENLAETAGQSHEARTRATREAGIRLPLDELAEQHRLDQPDRILLETLLVLTTTLTRGDSFRGLNCGRLARTAGNWDPERTQRFLPQFLPDSSLRRSGTVTVDARGSTVAEWCIEIAPGLLTGLLTGTLPAPAATGQQTAPAADLIAWLAGAGVELPTATARELVSLWGWLAHRDTVINRWGFGGVANLPAATSILFHGPSGTGKTITARALARALGLECRLVTCTDILNKYVGETEKRLRNCFMESAEDGSVLLFDEADALFGRRGDVERASDRLFNAEVNAALVELEKFPGICILTTNHLDLLDPAVLRRVRAKVRFGPPEPAVRARIWRCHLPPAAPLAPDVDLDRLGREHELTGGQIANAAIIAAARAATRLGPDYEGTAITMADLEAAAEQELAATRETAGLRDRLGF
ncbi:MAG: ATP-binding protein [bacterium]